MSDGAHETDGTDETAQSDEYEVAHGQIAVEVDKIIKNDRTINNLFKPLKYLGTGGYSHTYAGNLVQSNKIVAMKFVPSELAKVEIETEYTIYTYLNAIQNSTVEKYGIPAVYHYGKWKEFTMLGVTLLDSQFTRLYMHILDTPGLAMSYIDILIVFREFVKVTKYMHSHGVCHNDIKRDNMMFRKNNLFLFGK